MTIDLGAETAIHSPSHPSNFQKTYRQQRWYFDPLPADDNWPATDDSWPAFSTVKKAWGKEFNKTIAGTPNVSVSLDAWRVALYAHSEHKWRSEPDPDLAVTMLARSAKDDLAKAQDRGTQVHDVLEALLRGQKGFKVGKLAVPYARSCQRWIDEVKPEAVYIEAAGFNRTLGYAGALDLMAMVDGQLAIVDHKTRAATAQHACYEEEACQPGGAYAHFEYIIIEVGGEVVRLPMPQIDIAYIVSFKPDDYAMYPIDPAPAFDAFKSMLHMWHEKKEGQALARKAIGKPRIAEPETVAIDEGDEITDAQRQALIDQLKKSHPAVRDAIKEWQQQAMRAGLSFHMLDCPRQRRLHIAAAAVMLACLTVSEPGFGDAEIRGLLAAATGSDEPRMPTIAIGALLGALHLDQAERLAELVDTFGQYPIRYDIDGEFLVGSVA